MNYFLLTILTGIFLSLPWDFTDNFPLIAILSGWLSVFLLIKITFLKNGALIGYLAGIIFYAISFRWVIPCIIIYFTNANTTVISLLFILFILYHALQFPIFIYLYKNTKNKILDLFCLRFAFSFCVVEFIFYKIFPISIAHSQAKFTQVAELSSIFGIYTITFFMFWISESFLVAIKNKKFKFFILPALLICVCLIFHANKINFYKNTNFEKQKFIIIQKNDIMEEIFDEYFYYGKTFLKDLIKNEIKNNQRPILILPEVAYDSSISQKNLKAPELEKILNHTSIIFGSYTLDKDEKLFNSAVSTDSNNRYSIYNKKYLLPFGEKVPFATFLNKFGIKPYDELEIFKGKHNKPLYIDNFGKKIVVAPMICYEDIISESLMDNSMKKSNVLVSLSKDTWFRGIAKKQHSLLASFRAIENGKFLLRASESGISSIISPTLKTIRIIPEHAEGIISYDVPLISKNTIYTKVKNLFWWFGCLLMMLIFIKNKCHHKN